MVPCRPLTFAAEVPFAAAPDVAPALPAAVAPPAAAAAEVVADAGAVCSVRSFHSFTRSAIGLADRNPTLGRRCGSRLETPLERPAAAPPSWAPSPPCLLLVVGKPAAAAAAMASATALDGELSRSPLFSAEAATDKSRAVGAFLRTPGAEELRRVRLLLLLAVWLLPGALDEEEVEATSDATSPP